MEKSNEINKDNSRKSGTLNWTQGNRAEN